MYSGVVLKTDAACPKCKHEFEIEVDADEIIVEAVDQGYVHEDQAIDEVEVPLYVWAQLWRDGLITSIQRVTIRDLLDMYV